MTLPQPIPGHVICHQRPPICLFLAACPFGGPRADAGAFSRDAPGVVQAKGTVRHECLGANSISISIDKCQADPIGAIGLRKATLGLAPRVAAAHNPLSILHKLWQGVYQGEEITPY